MLYLDGQSQYNSNTARRQGNKFHLEFNTIELHLKTNNFFRRRFLQHTRCSHVQHPYSLDEVVLECRSRMANAELVGIRNRISSTPYFSNQKSPQTLRQRRQILVFDSTYQWTSFCCCHILPTRFELPSTCFRLTAIQYLLIAIGHCLLLDRTLSSRLPLEVGSGHS